MVSNSKKTAINSLLSTYIEYPGQNVSFLKTSNPKNQITVSGNRTSIMDSLSYKNTGSVSALLSHHTENRPGVYRNR